MAYVQFYEHRSIVCVVYNTKKNRKKINDSKNENNEWIQKRYRNIYNFVFSSIYRPIFWCVCRKRSLFSRLVNLAKIYCFIFRIDCFLFIKRVCEIYNIGIYFLFFAPLTELIELFYNRNFNYKWLIGNEKFVWNTY